MSATANQIPTTLVKARPLMNVPVQAPVPMQIQPVQVHSVQLQSVQLQPVQVQPVQVQPVQAVPVHVQGHPINIPKPNTPKELNKLFNDMKSSKKPIMKITMKAPSKSQSIFPDPFSLFGDNK